MCLKHYFEQADKLQRDGKESIVKKLRRNIQLVKINNIVSSLINLPYHTSLY